MSRASLPTDQHWGPRTVPSIPRGPALEGFVGRDARRFGLGVQARSGSNLKGVDADKTDYLAALDLDGVAVEDANAFQAFSPDADALALAATGAQDE